MGSKGPAISQSQNLPPWRWKLERAPQHENTGPVLQVSVNIVDITPLVQDGKDPYSVVVDCIETAKSSLQPSSMNQPVIPLRESPVLEDGKQTQTLESQCLENSQQELIPHRENQAVIRAEVGVVKENVRMNKALV